MSGRVPFGLRQHEGQLVPDPGQAVVVREIADAFVASGGRMKAAAATLNAKGFRTRQGAPWSDTAVSRALRVMCNNGLVLGPLRDRCAALLDARSAPDGAPERRSVHPFGSAVHCRCGGRMYLIGNGAAGKFVCRDCRAKVPSPALERAFEESLSALEVAAGDIVAAFSDSPRAAELARRLGDQPVPLSRVWGVLEAGERRQLVDVAVSRILVDHDHITVVFGIEPDSSGVCVTPPASTLPTSHCSTPPENRATQDGNTIPPADQAKNGAANSHHGVNASGTKDRAATPSSMPDGSPALVTVGGAAALLHTSRKAIYAMVERGQLPGAVRVGRRLLFRRNELLNSVSGSRAPSPKEVRR